MPATTQGVAFPTTLSFSIDHALGYVTSEGEKIIREVLLPRIECLEEQISKVVGSLVTEQVGNVKFRGGEALVLTREDAVTIVSGDLPFEALEAFVGTLASGS